jgi:hypothetical protein
MMSKQRAKIIVAIISTLGMLAATACESGKWSVQLQVLVNDACLISFRLAPTVRDQAGNAYGSGYGDSRCRDLSEQSGLDPLTLSAAGLRQEPASFPR